MGLYEFIIKDKSGNVVASLDSATQRSFEVYLNKSGSAGFTISPTDPKVTQDLLLLGNKELYIYRAGTLVWGGELGYRKTDVADGREGIMVTAKGFFDLLSKKIIGSAATPKIYTNTDAGQIAWDIINTVQTGTNASFGISAGSIPASVNRDRTYEFKNVKDAIEGLSSLNINNGFDFEIDANKQFSVFYPRKGLDKSDLVFEYGKNILSFSETLDATDMANEILVLGSGNGSEMITSVRDSNATTQSQYKIRQKVLSFKDVIETATLNDNGDKELALRQVQQQIISLKTKGNLEPFYGSYVVGDSVRVKINYGIISIDTLFRIYGIKVKISDEDDEDIELVFNP